MEMKWILFTGTWKLTNKQVETDVRDAVREVLTRGDGVLTGGSTGVDYFAMDEALKLKPDGSYLKVVIPALFEDYLYDYYTNWCQLPITKKEIDDVASILKRIKELNPANLVEMPYKIITQENYYMRDTEEVKRSNEVYAFQVNNSVGTQDTIEKARKSGLPITVHKKYII